MSHGSTEHHLDEAHHAEHAAHDHFTRNVAVTMAIIAAGLAFVTLLSHRQHNRTLQLQIKANDNLTMASDKWSYYQAKKNRQYMNQGFADLLEVTAPATGKEMQARDQVEKWRSTTKKYEEDSKEIEKEARALSNNAEGYEEQAHHSHAACDFFDYGHLGIDFGLVVCSLAILTRKSLFWFLGTAIAVVSLCLALTGFAAPFIPSLLTRNEPAHGDKVIEQPHAEPAGDH
jgi:hypothetical protein